VLSGVIIAGVGADLIGDLVNNYFHLLTRSGEKKMRMASALFLGACWQSVVVIISDRIKNTGNKK